MRIVELIINGEDDTFIEAISVVENPAIEEDFVALNSQKKFEFAEQDAEKRILVGPILIPNKPIYRQNAKDEYYIYFSRDTVRKASQLYLKQDNHHNATLEHQEKIQDLYLVESWIVEDKENDKSNLYNMDVPVGTWKGAIKVDNDTIWNDHVKEGKVKGFSIEGYFADKAELDRQNHKEEELAKKTIAEVKEILKKD